MFFSPKKICFDKALCIISYCTKTYWSTRKRWKTKRYNSLEKNILIGPFGGNTECLLCLGSSICKGHNLAVKYYFTSCMHAQDHVREAAVHVYPEPGLENQ